MTVITEVDRVHAQSQPFRRRLSGALAAVELALATATKPYIAYSGGKDSLALMWLVHSVREDVTVAWTDDELEYPEVVEHMAALQAVAGDQMMIKRGTHEHAGWFTPWSERPYFRDPIPGTFDTGMSVDDWMAACGYDLVFTGVRGEESRRRRDALAQTGPLYRVASAVPWHCTPLAWWGEHDVWALIAREGLPYSPVYDRLDEIGVKRERMRIGPLPLAHRDHLEEGWPELFVRLEARYGQRWR